MTITDVPVAILAGGLATRLRPITEKIPKALVEVAGRPFVEHQLELLRANGVVRVVLCVGYLGERVAEHIGDGAAFGLDVRYSFDGDKLLGTGGALRRALPHLGSLFWILYGDSYLDVDYPAILDHFLATDALGLMTVLRNEDRWDKSNLLFRDGQLLCYTKRSATPDMMHIDYGLSLLRSEALLRLPAEEPSDLADLFSALVAEGRMTGCEMRRRFYEIGSHRGLSETQDYLLARPA